MNISDVLGCPCTGMGTGVTLVAGGSIGHSQACRILTTGQTTTDGGDKLNSAWQRVISGTTFSQDVFTISDGKVGIGTTSPEFQVEIAASNQARLRITGPAAGGVGAGSQLTESSDRKSEILTTGGAAAQGLGKRNLAAFSARAGVRRHFSIDLPVDFTVLVLSTLAGEQIKIWLHLPISGNVLGLFVLLLCFRLRLIPPQLIEEAANRLLFVLPALFIPIFVSAIGQGQLSSKIGWVLLPTLLGATAGLWMFVGHLAQHLLRQSFHNE